MKITPSPSLGAQVEGVDLRRLTDAAVQALLDAVYRHRLLVFRGVDLDDAAYLAMARRFGTPQVYFQPHYHHPDHPEIFVSNNVPVDGRRVGVAGTGRMWHSDYQFFEQPLPLTFVYPRIVPTGGGRGTLFVDMVRAWQELPAALRQRLAGVRCFHDAVLYYKVQPWDVDKGILELMEEFHREAPGAWHPAVIRHPRTGSEALYLSGGFTTRVEGLGQEAGQQLLQAVFDFLTAPERVHTQPWQVGDLLLWDNRQVMHRSSGTLHGQPSRSHRIGIYDGLPFHVDRRVAAPAAEGNG